MQCAVPESDVPASTFCISLPSAFPPPLGPCLLSCWPSLAPALVTILSRLPFRVIWGVILQSHVLGRIHLGYGRKASNH